MPCSDLSNFKAWLQPKETRLRFLMDLPVFLSLPPVKAKHLKRERERKRTKEKRQRKAVREVVMGNCFWQLFVQAPDFFCLYANPASPHWKTGQVPLMSNLFQRSRVWA